MYLFLQVLLIPFFLQVTRPYDMLHVTPPMETPEALKENKQLANEGGFLDVDKHTLRHVK